MQVFPRTQFGNPILRTKAKRVPLAFIKTKKFKNLIQRMIYTMRRAPGVGLAANQIGSEWALAVMEIRKSKTRPDVEHKGPIVIVNPKITWYSQKKVSEYEGCLSLYGVRGKVSRSDSVTVEYYNEEGEKVNEKASGLWARIFQHEIDHLNGITYMDRVEDKKTIISLKEFEKRILNKKK